jgi:hypothetical protein
VSSSVYDVGVVTVEDTLERRDTRGLKRATTFHLDDYFYPRWANSCGLDFSLYAFLGQVASNFFNVIRKATRND